ncbi:interleukin-27 subunit beta [Tiliqua scincoides]|uniref:interleukin-27 subunit beta n=1 Tax=Tiliqua scincoides TaxID=71010 RepID=UPI0034629F9A
MKRLSLMLEMLWILTLSLVLPSCSASCEDTIWFDKDGANYVHQQYANLEASEVVLHCPIPEGTSLVEWRVNDTKGPILKEESKDGSLVLQNISLAEEGEYSCHEPITGQVLRSIHLQLGYPPEKPSVWCRSISYLSAIHCTWKLEPKTHLDTSFFSTYRYGMEGEKHECIQPVIGANSCSITDIQMFSIIPYMLNVTAVNPLGTATNLFPVFLNQIIKPDPPEGLKISPIQGESRKLLLEWNSPSSWLLPEYFPLKYLIRYSRDGTNHSKKINSLEQTSFILTGIRSGATYYAQVAAKDFLDHGEYSDWSSPAFGAAWVPE